MKLHHDFLSRHLGSNTIPKVLQLKFNLAIVSTHIYLSSCCKDHLKAAPNRIFNDLVTYTNDKEKQLPNREVKSVFSSVDRIRASSTSNSV